MALTKTTQVDQIEVLANNNIQVRTATIIKEDDTELSRSFHRHVLTQGDDLTGQDARVVAIANAIWSL
jgi:hypothetical protein